MSRPPRPKKGSRPIAIIRQPSAETAAAAAPGVSQSLPPQAPVIGSLQPDNVLLDQLPPLSLPPSAEAPSFLSLYSASFTGDEEPGAAMASMVAGSCPTFPTFNAAAAAGAGAGQKAEPDLVPAGSLTAFSVLAGPGGGSGGDGADDDVMLSKGVEPTFGRGGVLEPDIDDLEDQLAGVDITAPDEFQTFELDDP